MPQEIISIRDFGGIVGIADKEDVYYNPQSGQAHASDSLNVDGDAEMGILKGIPVNGSSHTANSVAIPDVYQADWIKYERPDVSVGINDATNANPIVITTASAHNLVSGDKVVVSGVLGNTAANGTWRITVVTSTTFSIPIAGNGAYIADPGDLATYTGGTKWDLVYVDKEDNDITVIEDFYNSETTYRTLNDVSNPLSGTVVCVKTFNNQAQIGARVGTNNEPGVVHRLISNKSFFNNNQTALAGLHSHYGIAARSSDTQMTVASATLSGAAAGYFQAGILYAWRCSLVFDGIQESELDQIPVTDTAVATDNTCAVVLQATNAGVNFANAGWDKRITSVKVYRAESSDGTEENLGLYRLVGSVDINNSGWAASGNHYVLTFTDTGGYPEGGATYEEETGLLENAPLSLTKYFTLYNINEVGGGYHWTAQSDLSSSSSPVDIDWRRYIFRSKRFRPNMFDWTRDFLVLPRVPTALAWYQDKLYAFSENEIYRINPELLLIEDIFTGAGCAGHRGVTVTEFGMFFCNTNGAYWMDDRVHFISDVIKNNTSGGKKWGTLQTTFIEGYIVLYDATKRYVLFIGNDGTPEVAAWALYVPSLYDNVPRWDYWDLSAISLTDTYSGAFNGKDGEIYFSDDAQAVELFAGATFRPAAWSSPEFHLGEPSQNKSWNKIIYDARAGGGTATVKYATEGSDPASGTTVTSGANINIYKKTLQVYAAVTTPAEIDSIDIVVRPLYGKR